MRLLALVILFIACGAWADDLRPVSLNIKAVDQTRFDVVLKVPVKAGKKQDIEVVFDELTTASAKRSFVSNSSYIEQWQITRDKGLLDFNVGVVGITNSSGDVLLRMTDVADKTITAVLNADQQSFTLASPKAMGEQNIALTYIVLGVEHILIGLDHLLFVACLVYISATFKKLLLTITGFTLAHSITLFLAATDVVLIAIVPVEAVIALSIVFLAWEIAKNNRDSISLKYPVLVSSSFGLLHGFGFASVLSDIGLPESEKLMALLSFNIGVEIGQLVFVAILCALFWLATQAFKSINKETLRLPAGYLCGSVAMFWLLQRLAAF